MRHIAIAIGFVIYSMPVQASDIMLLTSEDFTDGGQLAASQVLQGFGCSGGNRSPQLAWSGAPVGTKSYAVTAYDPDAPTGSGWWHWVAYDIPATVTKLVAGASGEGMMPKGSQQGRTDFSSSIYGGACPPAGSAAHRYVFTVYALDIDKLPVDASASPAMVGFFLNQYALSKATITARYGR